MLAEERPSASALEERAGGRGGRGGPAAPGEPGAPGPAARPRPVRGGCGAYSLVEGGTKRAAVARFGVK